MATVTDGVTVGIDIGTTSVKALAVAEDGTVLERARVEHEVRSPGPDQFEHDAEIAWRSNVLEAYERVRNGRDVAPEGVAAVNVAAMVPSLCAVDRAGHPVTPGLLYGDVRGGVPTGANPSESGELVDFLHWCTAAAPDATGYWPAQAVANDALCGVGGIDTVTAMTALPLFDFTSWDVNVAGDAGCSVDQLPVISPGSDALGRTPDGALVGGGTIDAFAEQLVAGADNEGDVLVILGTTLIVWCVSGAWREVTGLWTVPHTAPGLTLIGGASNAGGLFLNWARRLLGLHSTRSEAGVVPALNPAGIPTWEPYVRGERVPLHDANRRAALHELDLTMGPASAMRAAYEASGFVVSQLVGLSGIPARRIVATGGGVRVDEWVQALADCTGLPVDVVAVPEGGAYGAAYLARITAGLEPDASGASRWAATARRCYPADAWVGPCRSRFERFSERAGA